MKKFLRSVFFIFIVTSLIAKNTNASAKCGATDNSKGITNTALDASQTQTNVSCYGGSNGSATVTASGGTMPYTYAWAPSGGTAATATGLAAGNYTVTITDNAGASITKSFNITQPAALVATASAITNIACRGEATGSATVSVSGGTGAYSYLWAPTATGGTTATASGLTAGTYTVTVMDANGCQTTRSFTITEPNAILSATTTSIGVSCNGGSNGSASVFVSGGTPGYTYLWAPLGGTTASVSGRPAGNYTCTITDANGCTLLKYITISTPAAVSITTSKNDVSCNGGVNGTATVTVSGGTGPYTYFWSPSGGTAATATGLAAGTYTCAISDGNSCSYSASVTVGQPAALTASTSKTDVLCNGQASGTASVLVSGGSGNYTYLWSPSGGTAATATGLASGNYSVLITDANGCTLTKNFTINQPTVLNATTSQVNATCITQGQASVTPSGGTPGYTYLWSPSGGTAATATGLAPGNYSVLITDANGCSITKNFTITTTNTLIATQSQTNVLCNGSNTGTATVAPSGAPGPYSYVWSPSGGNAATALNLAAGNYSVTITAANSCSIVKNFTISQPSAIVATAGSQTNISCNGGSNGSATVNVIGGTGAYTYSWAPSGGFGATATGLAAGTYTVTVTDANLCTATKTFTITQPATLDVSSVLVPTDGIYKNGDNLNFTVNYNNNVTVTGTPYIPITLNTGGTKQANYISGSGTSFLTFRYTVTATDKDLDGISLATSITLNGGTIQGVSGCSASNVLSGVLSTAGVRINAFTPDINGIMYVKKGGSGVNDGSSWANAIGEVADALIAAKNLNTIIPGKVKQIWVAGGTYKPLYSPADNNFGNPANRDNAFLLVNDVKVYGGFAGTESTLTDRDLSITVNKSILSGDFNGDDVVTSSGATLSITGNTENAYHVLISAGNVGSAEINGFTVKGGNASGSGSSPMINSQLISNSYGGGMINRSSSPSINQCSFTANQANLGGGGMYNVYLSSPSINLCSFTANQAINSGGGLFNDFSTSPIINQCSFIVNKAKFGGGMENVSSSSPRINQCSFIANNANNAGGGIYDSSSSLKIFNSLFSSNHSGSAGGAICFYGTNCTPIIHSTTFSANSANGGGQAIYAGFSNTGGPQVRLYNSIIWNNAGFTGNNNLQDNFGSFVLDKCILQYPSTGFGFNISGNWQNTDPLFVDPDGADNILGTVDDDLALRYGSPAIGSGDNSLYEAADGNTGNNSLTTDKDLAGNPRVYGSNIDMGAYELQTTTPQTITANAQTKTYGDAPFILIATASSGLEVSYASADNTIAQAFQDATDGNKWKLNIKKAGTVNITASQAGGNGYDSAPDVVFSLTINQKPVTLSIKPTATFTKVYDANANATVQVSDLMPANGDIINNDAVQFNLSSSVAQYDTKDVGSGKTITLPIANVQLSGAQASNYSIANVTDLSSASASITVKPLTITANNNTKTYDGSSYIGGNGVSYDTFVLGEDPTVLSGTLSYGGNSQGATNTGTYTIVPSGLSSPNYNITYINGQLNISPNNVNTLTFNAQTAGSTVRKTYGDAGIDASAIASSGLTASYQSSNPAVASVSTTGQVSILNTGTTTITVSQEGNNNYGPASPITFEVQVAQKTLNVTAQVQSKVYGDADPSLTYTSVGLVGADVITGTLSRASGENVGTYAINQGNLSAGNNYSINYVSANLAVTAKALSVTAQAQSKVYGDADPSLTFTSVGLVGVDVIMGTLSRTSGENVGTYAINQGNLSAGKNYSINYVSANLAVTAKALSVTAQAKSKVYGDADPSLTYTSIGLVGADGITGSLTRTTGENVGAYAISQGNLSAGSNYNINYVAANLGITKALLTITANNKAICQSNSIPGLSVNYSGFKNGETENSLSTKPTVGTSANSGSSAGTYVLAPSGAVSNNYNFTYINGTLTINALPSVSISSSKSNGISKGESLELTATGNGTYTWLNANGIISGQNTAMLTIRPTQTTTYTVIASNASGCSQTATYTVEVSDDLEAIHANNIITPNNDGTNDVWKVENIDMYPNNEVKIFDRAGRIIYTKKGYNNTWDGTLNGTALAEGTYYYVIDFGPDRLKQKGFITLIRE